MCRDVKCLDLAAKAAEQSRFDKSRHGAVLIKGGSIINVTSNNGNYSSFGSRFRDPNKGMATHHAELSCILGLPKNVTNGSSLYCARINKKGLWRLSKPCKMCQKALKFVGIKKVIYTTGPGEYKSYRL
tara:strand:+ start:64 stop:450 length:387 start_codon:yes stop_codon:yes gene_type:complete